MNTIQVELRRVEPSTAVDFPFSQKDLRRLTEEYMRETYGQMRESDEPEFQSFYQTQTGKVYDAMTYVRDRALMKPSTKRIKNQKV